MFCPACGHTKMHFETEKEALTFLRYNGDEILEETGKRPIRAYYCDVCVAWHVTSLEHFYKESSYDVLKERYRHENKIDISILRDKIAEVQEVYDKGLYKLAAEKAISVLKPIVTKHIYVEQFVKETIDPCYVIIDRCLVMLYMMIDKRLKNTTIINIELRQECSSVDAIIQKLQTKKDTRLNQMYVENLAKFKKLRQKIKEIDKLKPLALQVLKNEIKQASKLYSTQQYAKCMDKSVDVLKHLSTCGDDELDMPRTQIYSELYNQIIDSAMHCFSDIDSLIQEHKLDMAQYENFSLSQQLSDIFGNYKSDENLNMVADECNRLVLNRKEKILEEKYKDMLH